jgi:hypothetical protein
MLIKELQILNCRKVKQAVIQFHGPGLQIIQGKNQSGKSTIGQSIQLMMEGPHAFTPGMITFGESQAEVVGVTDDGVIIHTQISGKTVKQTVSKFDETAGKYVAVSGGVREFLNSIRSGLEFPWAMRDMTDAKIIEILKDRTGITKRIAEIDAALKDKETARRDVGRDKTKMGTITPVKQAGHPEPIDDIQEERKKAKSYMDSKASLFSFITSRLKEKCTFGSIQEIEEFIGLVKGSLDEANKRLANLENNVGKTYTQVDLDDIEKQLQKWVEEEQAAKAYDEYQKKLEVVEELTKSYESLTVQIEGLREDRKKTLSNMRLGVKGLEIGEDNLLYHNGNLRGITETNKIGNWSTAESVQVFFQIAVRFSGEMKVLCVDNGESLDSSAVKAISDWAEKSNFMVIILKVGEVPAEIDDDIIYVREGEILTK